MRKKGNFFDMKESEIILLPDGTTIELSGETLEELSNNKGEEEEVE